MPNPPLRACKTVVTKKLAPDQAGAKKLAQRFGEALVCVRYRQDAEAGRRYTTVELVVDEGPIPIDRRTPPIVHVRIPYQDQALRRAVMQMGGTWNARLRAWCLRKEAAQALQLQGQVLRKRPDVDGARNSGSEAPR